MSPHRPGPTLAHVPALDGLRGLALIGVLLFHANGALPGGYLGVDLFFVLSGYLITSLLLAERRRHGTIALGAFWVRRARRLFPALLALMPAIAFYGRFVARPDELSGLRADALATLAYVANWCAVFSHKSYWELFTSPSPLEHTWSLAIEEQFYLVWPLLVAVVLRRGSVRTLLVTVLLLAAGSVAAMLALYDPENVSRVYLGTDTRASGLLAGAALACVVSPGSVSARRLRTLDGAGLAALAFLGWCWCQLEGQDSLLYRGGLWANELAALVVITCAVQGPSSVVARVLSFHPFRLVGTISYGLYLWHWPVDVVLAPGRVHLHGVTLQALRIAVTFAIAVVSYVAIERPIRRRGLPFGRPLYMVPAAVAAAVLLVVRATNARQPPAAPLPPPVVAEVVNAGPPVPAFRVLVLGDSTANSLGWGLRGVQRAGVEVTLLGHDGCTMLWDRCDGPDWARHVTEHQPHASLVFLGGAFMHGLHAEGRWRRACHHAWDAKLEGALKQRLAELPSPTSRAWAVTIPYPLEAWETPGTRREVDCINATIRKAAAAAPGVRVLDLGGWLCPGGACKRETEAGETVRPDGVHYSIPGAADMSRWVLDTIQSEPR